MPIYEYRCRECGHVREVVAPSFRVSDPPACPKCGGGKMDRLISAPAAVTTGRIRSGATCCGRDQRCSTPPCTTGSGCRRD